MIDFDLTTENEAGLTLIQCLNKAIQELEDHADDVRGDHWQEQEANLKATAKTIRNAVAALLAPHKMRYIPGVQVRYHGATNTRGSRVSLELPGRGLPRKFISYDHSFNRIEQIAEAALAKVGFKVHFNTDGPPNTSVVLVDWKDGDLVKMWTKVGK